MSVGVLMRGPPGKELQGPLETEWTPAGSQQESWDLSPTETRGKWAGHKFGKNDQSEDTT